MKPLKKYKPSPLTKEERDNGCKSILRFMGYKYQNDNKAAWVNGYYINEENGDLVTLCGCDYEENWNSIFAVLKAIQPVECSYTLGELKHTIFYTLNGLHIEDVFRDISAFLCHYNKTLL